MLSPRAQVVVFSAFAVTAAVATIVVVRGSAREVRATSARQALAGPCEPTAPVLVDAPLPAHVTRLLDLAFEAASSLPTQPHIRNRCRMQELVAVTCLELDQPRRALSFIERIDNWRRGSLYADLASHLQSRGDTGSADAYLDEANDVSRRQNAANEQEWPKERIQGKIAAVRAARGPVAERSQAVTRLEMLDSVVEHGGFEEVCAALRQYAGLYEEAYVDTLFREGVVERVRKAGSKVAPQILIETVLELAESALRHDDVRTAATNASWAHELIHAAAFHTEDRLSLVARLVDVRFRAGDEDGARQELDRARVAYDEEAPRIVDIYRARCLRALAESYVAVGDRLRALESYARAVEAGVVNPNSRPRADDLVATCCSLARHEIDPGEALMKRLGEIRASLGEPW